MDLFHTGPVMWKAFPCQDVLMHDLSSILCRSVETEIIFDYFWTRWRIYPVTSQPNLRWLFGQLNGSSYHHLGQRDLAVRPDNIGVVWYWYHFFLGCTHVLETFAIVINWLDCEIRAKNILRNWTWPFTLLTNVHDVIEKNRIRYKFTFRFNMFLKSLASATKNVCDSISHTSATGQLCRVSTWHPVYVNSWKKDRIRTFYMFYGWPGLFWPKKHTGTEHDA